jgi:hypothetical protein
VHDVWDARVRGAPPEPRKQSALGLLLRRERGPRHGNALRLRLAYGDGDPPFRAEPANVLVDEVDLEQIDARRRRGLDEERDDDGRAGRHVTGEAGAVSLENEDGAVRVQPAVRAADRWARLRVPRPGVGAAVRDPHVDRPELADLEPGFEFDRLDHRRVPAGFDGSPAPMAVALGKRHDRNVADRAPWRGAGRQDGAQRFGVFLGEAGRSSPRVQLWQVRASVERAAARRFDPWAQDLVLDRFRPARCDVVEQARQVVERLLDVPGGVCRLGARVQQSAEAQCAIVAHEPILVVRPPRHFLEPVALLGVEPPARKPVLLNAAVRDQLRQSLDERWARDLVGVNPEDPISGALFVEPGEVPLQVREFHAQEAIGGSRILLQAAPDRRARRQRSRSRRRAPVTARGRPRRAGQDRPSGSTRIATSSERYGRGGAASGGKTNPRGRLLPGRERAARFGRGLLGIRVPGGVEPGPRHFESSEICLRAPARV